VSGYSLCLVQTSSLILIVDQHNRFIPAVERKRVEAEGGGFRVDDQEVQLDPRKMAAKEAFHITHFLKQYGSARVMALDQGASPEERAAEKKRRHEDRLGNVVGADATPLPATPHGPLLLAEPAVVPLDLVFAGAE